jgi:hypothetical protein
MGPNDHGGGWGQKRFANRNAEIFRHFVYIYAAVKFGVVAYIILSVVRCYSNFALVALSLLDDVAFRRAQRLSPGLLLSQIPREQQRWTNPTDLAVSGQ